MGTLEPSVSGVLSEDTIVDWICRSTPRTFRAAVQETDCFLYRGSTKEELQRTLQQPDADLLLPETYDNAHDALAYFECLEERLRRLPSISRTKGSSVIAMPSNGHIATSNPTEAGKWGPVVSVWPLGTDWSYIWPKDREVFYDAAADKSSSKRTCRDDQLMVDTDLERALKQPREVLFASGGMGVAAMSAFLIVPRDQDDNLRKKLRRINYGL